MAGADAHLEHDRRVRGLRQGEPVLHGGDDRGQVRPRVEQPHLRFHRERVAALLHDRRAFAVILADDDQRAARHAGRGEVRQRVARHIGPRRRLPRHRAAQRIHDRGRQHGRRARLRRRGFEMHAEIVEHVLGIRQHVHQMRDRRALVAAHIGNARLQQRLGDREDALAMEHLALAELQALDFARKRAFDHDEVPGMQAAHALPRSGPAPTCASGTRSAHIHSPGRACQFGAPDADPVPLHALEKRRGPASYSP